MYVYTCIQLLETIKCTELGVKVPCTVTLTSPLTHTDTVAFQLAAA